MYCLTMSWQPLVLPLFLHGLADWLRMVHLTATTSFLAICRYPVPQCLHSLLFISHCFCLFTAYYYHASACLFLTESNSFVCLKYCLAPPSACTVPLLSGPTEILFTADFTAIFQGCKFIDNLCYCVFII